MLTRSTKCREALSIIIIGLLLLLLSMSCQSPQREWSGTQCAINLVKNECYCRGYKFSKDYIGKTSGVTTHSLDKCENMVGYGPQDYAGQVTFFESVRLQITGAKPRKATSATKPSANKRRHEAREPNQDNHQSDKLDKIVPELSDILHE